MTDDVPANFFRLQNLHSIASRRKVEASPSSTMLTLSPVLHWVHNAVLAFFFLFPQNHSTYMQLAHQLSLLKGVEKYLTSI